MKDIFYMAAPCILPDYDNNVYYCYGNGNIAYMSKDLTKWENADCDLPDLCQPAAFKAKNEYRLYSVTDDGIVLFVSNSPMRGYVKRDLVIGYEKISKYIDKDSVLLSHPSVFNDPVSGDHFLTYGCGKSGIYTLRINPRNGLAYEDGAGTCILTMPEFNNYVTDGYIYYDESSSIYYLFATFGNEKHSSVRIGKCCRPNGVYTDFNSMEFTDTNNFDDRLGFMVLAPMHFDDCNYIEGFSKPIVFKDFNGSLRMAYCSYSRTDREFNTVYGADRELISSLNFTYLITTKDNKLIPIPEGMAPSAAYSDNALCCDNKGTSSPGLLSCINTDDICGSYEFIKLTKEMPLSLADYVQLSILSPSQEGVSSTRNSWALSVPQKAGGRVELGGSLRGYWTLGNDNSVSIRYNSTTEIYRAVRVKIDATSDETLLLMGADNNNLVAFAKKYH